MVDLLRTSYRPETIPLIRSGIADQATWPQPRRRAMGHGMGTVLAVVVLVSPQPSVEVLIVPSAIRGGCGKAQRRLMSKPGALGHFARCCVRHRMPQLEPEQLQSVKRPAGCSVERRRSDTSSPRPRRGAIPDRSRPVVTVHLKYRDVA